MSVTSLSKKFMSLQSYFFLRTHNMWIAPSALSLNFKPGNSEISQLSSKNKVNQRFHNYLTSHIYHPIFSSHYYITSAQLPCSLRDIFQCFPAQWNHITQNYVVSIRWTGEALSGQVIPIWQKGHLYGFALANPVLWSVLKIWYL